MPDRSARIKLAMLLTASIVAMCVIAVVIMVGVYAWAHIVPPLEVEATSSGLRVTVNRSLLRDMTITVDDSAPVTIAELKKGVTVMPWSDFGLVASPTLHNEVRTVHAAGMSRFSRFETTINFIPPTQNGAVISSATSQTINYVSTAAEN